MDEDGAKRYGDIDWLSNLPESLLCQVLLNLPTKYVVKTSVLSTRWKNLWKHVPGLDLNNEDFQEYETFVNFVDNFLSLNSDSRLQRFKLKYESYDDDNSLIERWINTVLMRKVEVLDLLDDSSASWDLKMPQTLYTCDSLVCLTLNAVTFTTPTFVSLPCLKVMDLTILKFSDDLVLETLISRCPVLENLSIERSFDDDIQVLRVCSQSLLSFTHVADGSQELDEDLVVAIDAPRLEYLWLSDYRIANFVLKNSSSLEEVCVYTVFNFSFGKKFDPNDVPKRIMIRNFLVGISSVKDMTIASNSLEVIYDYLRCESLPLFRNLSILRVEFTDYRWEMLPIFLASCPNLKSLVVRCSDNPEEGGNDIVSGPGPWCLLSSLEYVEIERPLKGEAKEMKLVSYLLENSTILKKVTLCFDDL